MRQPQEERIQVGQIEMRFFVDCSHTNGHVALAEMIVPPGAKMPPPHFHSDVDETVQALEGTLRYRVDTEHFELRRTRRFPVSPRRQQHSA